MEPKHPKPPSKRTNVRRKVYNPECLTNALEAIRNGASIKSASKTFNVPRSTLIFRQRVANSADVPGPNPVLTKPEETALVEWIVDSCRCGFTRRSLDVQTSVAGLLKMANRENPFRGGLPGNKWYKLFVRRHPELNAIVAKPGRTAVSQRDVGNWFNCIEAYLQGKACEEVLSEPHRIFHMDELTYRLSPEDATAVLVTSCVDGDVIPPTVFFPTTPLRDSLAPHIPIDWGISLKETDLTKYNHFHNYIQNVLYPFLNQTHRKFPVILFIDGNKTHITLEISNLCKGLKIIILCLYPNAIRLCPWYHLSGCQEVITKTDFTTALKSIDNARCKANAVEDFFRSAGLRPWDLSAVDFKRCLIKNDPKTVTHQELHRYEETPPIESVLTKEQFYNIVGVQRFNDLKSTPEYTLTEDQRCLKRIGMHFESNADDREINQILPSYVDTWAEPQVIISELKKE